MPVTQLCDTQLTLSLKYRNTFWSHCGQGLHEAPKTLSTQVSLTALFGANCAGLFSTQSVFFAIKVAGGLLSTVNVSHLTAELNSWGLYQSKLFTPFQTKSLADKGKLCLRDT